MVNVTLAGGAAGFNWLPVFVALKNGMFAKRGLDVTVVRLGSVEKATAAVKSLDANLAITPPEGAIRDAATGGELRIVAANANQLPLSLIAHPRFQRVEDLKGATLGTSSMTEGTALYSMEILGKHGLKYPGDYEFAVVGVHPARWKALQEGTIDAALQPVPFNFMAVDAGFRNLGEATDYIPDLLFTALILNRTWGSSNRGVVAALISALVEATQRIYDDSDDRPLLETVVELSQCDVKYGAPTLRYMREKKLFPEDAAVKPSAFKKSVDVMSSAGLADPDVVAGAGIALDPSYRLEAASAS